MFQSHIGEFAALLTAFFWTTTAMVFESAGKKVGSLQVNYIRLMFAFIFISIYTLISRGLFLPVDASTSTWVWLLISGLVGFVLGDLFLFQAYVEIGARISMLIMSSVPPLTAILSYFVLGEKLTKVNILGMTITVLGIALVVLKKKEGEEGKVQFAHSAKGLFFAFLGAVGQATGMVISKFGMQNYNPFAATQIRIIAGLFGFTVLFFIMKRWGNLALAFKNKEALKRISVGALFGPFLGVSFQLLSLQYTSAGVTSTITAIIPVLIIPPAVILFKEKLTSKELFGSMVTIVGVAILFL
ncbi:EamA-like transporter family protein [Clostridium homopropionicum DSM 5847]|uniref:EamA-like transporter family protein n=1 Tax=Clostridium homopropionicum DSM 5847 TaxID=1121318 RepID=A0A0L6ZEZ5_9CLOT|nr:DMT family transporter [Clostridium homopropionicum]KOA21545.1 EamA-like transporter family protein [Clostridium homopropionicum DSM 5847]SFG06276.1 Uncharacterized membrane protein [Clostridium homopropionicum]